MSSPMRNLSQLHQQSLYHNCEIFLADSMSEHGPASYHLATGGGRIRLRACLDASLALGLSDGDAMRLAATIELLHNASLVHDDIQDGDKMRRGQPTVWAKYGTNVAICTGDYFITKAFGMLASVSRKEVLSLLLEETQQAVAITIKGQHDELVLSSSSDPQVYERIASQKAGPLLYLPLVLPLVTCNKTDLLSIAKRAASHFAIAYQILDDLEDCEDDRKNSRLNLLNYYLRHNSKEEAMSLTTQRVKHLLKVCERDFEKLPNGCASGLLEATRRLLDRLTERVNENCGS